MDRFRRAPDHTRVGFELETIDLEVAAETDVVHCSEHRDGRAIGELDVSVFDARLIVDRDGALAEKASEVAKTLATSTARVLPPIPIDLPNASGYRAAVELARGAAFPYVFVFAVASDDAIQSGVLVVVRSVSSDWPAADAAVDSLRILTRYGRPPNND